VAGGSPAAGHFLLRGQDKVTKEKAAQVRRPRFCCGGDPALLDQPGGLRNSRTVYTIA